MTPPRPSAFSQHALDRFIERAGFKVSDVHAACERLNKLLQHAQPARDGGYFFSKGWVLKTDGAGLVRTVYPRPKVIRKQALTPIGAEV